MRLDQALERITPVDRSLEPEVRASLDRLTKPPGSLGRLEELALRIACIQQQNPPRLGPKLLFVFAADHGISEEGVSAYPKSVTAQMTYNFLSGGAGINVLARHFGVHVEVVDVGVDHEFPSLPGLRQLKAKHSTGNFSRGPAMTREEAVLAVEVGIALAHEAADKPVFLLGAGEMGIGNSTSAAAIFSALTGLPAREVTGHGTGIDAATWKKKAALIEKGILANLPNPKDPLDVLSKVGGLEIGAMAGLILGAAAFHLPLVLDGYISTAAALLACRLSPAVTGFLFASHLSAESGHQAMLREIGSTPLVDLQMRLGEGTGACIGMSLIEAGVKILREMATFESAGVAGNIK
ncbi:MAG: nicotinate-nucleotide--dimethylbenzimidazole phosphoribosyltransferase [Candidatus Binatia bacterium]